MDLSERISPPFLERLWPLTAITGAYLLYFLRFGYDFGHSDQDEVLPLLLHRLDPHLLSQDWFVQTLAGQFSVRTYFVALLEFLSLGFSIETAVLIVYLSSWFLIAYGLFAIARSIAGEPITPGILVVLALVVTPQWTLGGNDLVHSMLVPTMPAWGLGLLGVQAALARRLPLAGLLFGLACWLQVLVGLQLVGIVGLTLLLQGGLDRAKREAWKPLFAFLLVFLLSSAPAVLPLAVNQFQQTLPPDGSTSPGIFYILAAFRAPHHYLPLAFSTHAAARFLLLATLLTCCLTVPRFRAYLNHTGFILRALLVVVFLLVGATFFTEISPSLFVTKLQLFKSTVLVKVFALVVLPAVLVKELPARLRSSCSRWAQGRVAGAITWGSMALLIVGLFVQVPALDQKVGSRARNGSYLALVEQWCRTQTPLDALFAVPPSVSSFRYGAQRAILVNHKAFPFQEKNMVIWFNRLQDLAPIPLPTRSTATLATTLDRAYEAQDTASLARLARAYDVTYVIRQTPLPGDQHNFSPVFSTGPWIVYHLEKRQPRR